MAQLFSDEVGLPANQPRKNFVFMAYPFTPPLSRDDYASVVKDLQEELPVRFWYFLDEVTTVELMRKIWRAILRSDLAVFDISGGNANVAFELGLSIAADRRCITMLKSGESNPLGSADLGYSERMEYTSAATLKARLRSFVLAQCSGLAVIKEISYSSLTSSTLTPAELEDRLLRIVQRCFTAKSITRRQTETIMGTSALAGSALKALRAAGVLRVDGAKGVAARWVFTDAWVYHDHQVRGS